MQPGLPIPDDHFLTDGVLIRRVIAWVIDLIVISVIVVGLGITIWMLGIATLGLAWSMMAVLPLVPALYHGLCLLGPTSATAGQQLCGLVVRRNDDLGSPTPLQAAIAVGVYYVTWALSGILLVVALFTARRRTLHDLASGLVVVRAEAMMALTEARRSWNMGTGSYPQHDRP